MTHAPRHIVIIGASSGLGRRIAGIYIARGWRVGISARSEGPLKAVADQSPDQVEWSSIDVTSPEAPRALNDLIARLGGMDILLNAAGCGWYNPDLDPADELHTVAVNVDGFTRIVDAAMHYFAVNGGGTLAAITSVAGVKGMDISAAYSATKRYQWAYLQALDRYVRQRRLPISVVDIRPGFIDTALLDRGPARLPMTMNPDRAASLIVKAIDRRRHVAYIDGRWGLVARLWSLLPAALWRRIPLPF